MRKSAVVTWLYDEVDRFYQGSSLVSLQAPTDHVGIAEGREPPTYPFVGIQEVSGTPQTAGIGGGTLRVHERTTDANDILQSVTYVRTTQLDVRLQPVTDGDRQLRDDLTEDLASHVEMQQRTGDTPEDMDILSVGDVTPTGRPDEFVYGDGIPLSVEYDYFRTDDDPDVAETVNVDVDVADEPQNSGSDAVDATFD
jgi:hypothetical protein